MVTPASFRGHFPEFHDPATYPDSSLAYHIVTAVSLQDVNRWGNLIDLGTELLAAHLLAIENRDKATLAAGGIPGAYNGPTAAKAVDKVSISYDTSAVVAEGMNFYNLSSYGLRYWNLAKRMGAGGMQIQLSA